MKHAVMATAVEAAGSGSVEVAAGSGNVNVHVVAEQTVCLAEAEYSQAELDAFYAEAPAWILRCKGTQYFLADSDSGEDARGYYCNYFDLTPEKAVFENGAFVGFYLCTDGFRYSGRGRESFEMDTWGYPGDDVFEPTPWPKPSHVFLFADEATHAWNDWALLRRDPEAEYTPYLDF